MVDSVAPVARISTAAVIGIEASMVEVEACITPGIPQDLHIHGLPELTRAGVQDRVRAAISNSSLDWPTRHLTVSLSPQDPPKSGNWFDLPIAVAMLAANGTLPLTACAQMMVVGELGLDGRIRQVPGVLPVARYVAEIGLDALIVPPANAAEARAVPGVTAITADSLRGLVDLLRGGQDGGGSHAPSGPPILPPPPGTGERARSQVDIADLPVSPAARRAMAASAAGGHHLLLYGASNTANQVLADQLDALLPPLDAERELEVAAIRSVAGRLDPVQPLSASPPRASLYPGGGRPQLLGGKITPYSLPQPGVAALAHHGVLHIDDLPSIQASVLDALAHVIEVKAATVCSAAGVCSFPAEFILAATQTLCPCDAAAPTQCRCTPAQIHGYRARVPANLLYRIDLHVPYRPETTLRPSASTPHSAESTAVIADLVAEARDRARKRLHQHGWSLNSQIPQWDLVKEFFPAAPAAEQLEDAVRQGRFTFGSASRVLRLAWTLADLDRQDRPSVNHLTEAMEYHKPLGKTTLSTSP